MENIELNISNHPDSEQIERKAVFFRLEICAYNGLEYFTLESDCLNFKAGSEEKPLNVQDTRNPFAASDSLVFAESGEFVPEEAEIITNDNNEQFVNNQLVITEFQYFMNLDIEQLTAFLKSQGLPKVKFFDLFNLLVQQNIQKADTNDWFNRPIGVKGVKAL